MKVILNNLISNAVKYRDRNKEEQFVKIEVFKKNELTYLVVEDNGIGIENPVSDKIFNMFYRATHHSTGSGLGLFIVKETIEKLGGSIWVKSQIGVGTLFTVTF